MAAVGLRSGTAGADDPTTSTPVMKVTVLGSITPATMRSEPVTRNMGRQRARTDHARCANPGAPNGSAGPTDGFHTIRFQRSDRSFITASYPPEGQRRPRLCVNSILRFTPVLVSLPVLWIHAAQRDAGRGRLRY